MEDQLTSNINIERAIISAIIFDPEIYPTMILNAEDFSLPFHRNIYATFKTLVADDKPIAEDFLKIYMEKEGKFDEREMLNVLSANPITQVEAYSQQIKDASLNRQLNLGMKRILSEDVSVSEKMVKIDRLKLDLESGVSTVEPLTGEQLINLDIPTPPKYETGIDFLDDAFGGFEMGQLVTVTGQQETGKTQLTNQILMNVIKGHRALTFSLEFNKRKLQEYLKKKKGYELSNLFTITQDQVSGDINEICRIIRNNHKKHGTRFITIDSQIMLHDESDIFATAELETTSFYRKLRALASTLDIIIFIIATKKLSANTAKARGIEVFGSKKASHFADIQLDLSFRDEDRDSGDHGRILWIGKNKQNGIHKTIELEFNPTSLEFYIEEVKPAYEVVYEMPDAENKGRSYEEV